MDIQFLGTGGWSASKPARFKSRPGNSWTRLTKSGFLTVEKGTQNHFGIRLTTERSANSLLSPDETISLVYLVFFLAVPFKQNEEVDSEAAH